MAKPHTFPTLFDDVKHIDVTYLKKWGYLEPRLIKKGCYTWKWRSDGSSSGSIEFLENTTHSQPYIELACTYNREYKREYRVNLVSTPSNLGNGVVWYFLCPRTNKRCRKLYLVEGYFLHREAFKGCMYERKSYRELDKTMGAYLRRDSHYEELYKKHFKKTYAEKPTKSYLRIMKQIQKGSRSNRAF